MTLRDEPRRDPVVPHVLKARLPLAGYEGVSGAVGDVAARQRRVDR